MSHVEGDFTSAFPAMCTTGDRAAIARGNTVEVYELPGRRLLRTISHGAAVNVVTFGGTGKERSSAARSTAPCSSHATTARSAQFALPASPGGIDAVEFLPDGRLVSSEAQRRLRVYDRGRAVLADIEIPMRVMSLRVDGTRLVTVPIVPIYASGAASPVLMDLERTQRQAAEATAAIEVGQVSAPRVSCRARTTEREAPTRRCPPLQCQQLRPRRRSVAARCAAAGSKG